MDLSLDQDHKYYSVQLPMVRKSRVIAEHELTNVLKAMMAPVRPYGSIFSHAGGAQKSLSGNFF